MKSLFKKIVSNFDKSNNSSNLVEDVVRAKTKKIKYGIIIGTAFFFVAIIVILGVVSYFLGLTQEIGERIENTAKGGCILCSTDELEKLKEEQFKSKINVIEDIFGSKIDPIVLASTVLFQGDYYEVMDAQYDSNYNEDEYKDYWTGVRDFFAAATTSSIDDYEGITQEEIDLLDLATIVMVNSNVDGKYNEESYKKALASNGLVADETLNNHICFWKSVEEAVDLINPFSYAKDLWNTITSGGTVRMPADKAVFFADTQLVCEKGFIGGTFADIKKMSDDTEEQKAQKQKKKEEIAQNIIDFAQFYRELFPEEDYCVYNGGDVGSGDMVNWRQCNQSWSNLSLGSSSTSVCKAGCLATSMSYLIKKSGTATTVDDLNPGTFVKNASFSGAALVWDFSGVAPSFRTIGGLQQTSKANLPSVLADILNDSSSGHPKFVVLNLTGGGQHWVAVDHVEGNTVYVLDPAAAAGSGLVEVTEAWRYAGSGSIGYRVFEATDVEYGSSKSTGTSTTTTQDYTSTTYQNRLLGLTKYYQCGNNLKNHTLGNSNVCKAGCITASLMGIYYMYTGEDVDVDSFLSDILTDSIWTNSAAGRGVAFDTGSTTPTFTANWGLSGETIGSDIDSIISTLKSGKKILVNLAPNNGVYHTTAGHYIMLDHYNESTDMIYVFDPGDKKKGKISGQGYQTKEFVQEQILNNMRPRGPWAISSSKVSTDNVCDTATGGDTDFIDFLGYLEGTGTCNYQGQGEGTGYTSYNLGDGAGMTTGFGITENYSASKATEVGYTNFKSDIRSGCTSKTYIDKMVPLVIEHYKTGVQKLLDGVSVNNNQLYALTSIAYNTGLGGGVVDVIDNIKSNGVDDFSVFKCMTTAGCSFGHSYVQGLTSRRWVEYELYDSGNFNAAKPSSNPSISNKSELEAYKSSHWPTNRKS